MIRGIFEGIAEGGPLDGQSIVNEYDHLVVLKCLAKLTDFDPNNALEPVPTTVEYVEYVLTPTIAGNKWVIR